MAFEKRKSRRRGKGVFNEGRQDAHLAQHGAPRPQEPAFEVLTCLVGGDVHGGELR